MKRPARAPSLSPTRRKPATEEKPRKAAKSRAAATPRAYHHGALKEALLAAAEEILIEMGVAGLTLREAARRVGVSHAAPKNHFGDARGLLSELAAVGFRRLAADLARAANAQANGNDAMDAIGRAYVGFARTSPGLFHLMYRSEVLDFKRPALAEALTSVSGVLREAINRRQASRDDASPAGPLETVAAMATAWCLVHGFATLLIDRRLEPMLAFVPGPDKPTLLLDAVLAGMKPRQTGTR